MRLLKQAKKEVPHFKKENINKQLLWSIFDLNDKYSEDVLSFILADELGYLYSDVPREELKNFYFEN